DLLFYTDGEKVYDASHRLMPGGENLGGNTQANQAAAISPVPGTPGQYYIFSNKATAGEPIIMSIVDMNLAGNAGGNQLPLGSVVTSVPTNVLSETEGMAVIEGLNDRNWLIAQNGGTITLSEITTSSSFTILNSITDPQINAVNFAFNAQTKKLAIVPGNASANIKIYAFDPNVGGFSLEETIQNSGRTGELLYDAAWSPNGEK